MISVSQTDVYEPVPEFGFDLDARWRHALEQNI